MRPHLRQYRKRTEGERARLLAFVLVGVSSAALGFLAVMHLNTSALFVALSLYEWWIIAASTLGGVVALFLSGDRLGKRGTQGLASAIAGGIWVTFVGSLIGGTLALPFYGTMFGPFIVTVTMLGAPLLALLWIVNLLGIHILLGIYRQERDTIFEFSDKLGQHEGDAPAQRDTLQNSRHDLGPVHRRRMF